MRESLCELITKTEPINRILIVFKVHDTLSDKFAIMSGCVYFINVDPKWYKNTKFKISFDKSILRRDFTIIILTLVKTQSRASSL